MNVGSSRPPYDGDELREEDLSPDPVGELRLWLETAERDPRIDEANAMCLATVSSDGQPSARMVLLRGLDERGLIFYTSYDSRKGHELAENARVSVVLFWQPLHRQVRIEGIATPLPDEESDAYFASRPRGHQLSAWASEQSEPIDDRTILDARLEHFSARFEGDVVPRPHSWGGYLISPVRFEFWQGRPNRLHDRLVVERAGKDWNIRRLQP